MYKVNRLIMVLAGLLWSSAISAGDVALVISNHDYRYGDRLPQSPETVGLPDLFGQSGFETVAGRRMHPLPSRAGPD